MTDDRAADPACPAAAGPVAGLEHSDVVKDSAGNERTEEQVRKIARDTAYQMGVTAVLDAFAEEVGGYDNLPADMTRCECHGLWYDECEAFR